MHRDLLRFESLLLVNLHLERAQSLNEVKASLICDNIMGCNASV